MTRDRVSASPAFGRSAAASRCRAGYYLAGLDRAYLRRELMAWRDGSRRTDPNGAMGIIARHLTVADIDAVAAHYAGLRRRARPTTR